jgi:hypothetical protein
LDFTCSCGAVVPQELRYCSVCLKDAGFPNVRKADRQDEQDALNVRVESSRRSAEARGAAAELADFVVKVSTSKAVMNRKLAAIHSWMNSDSPYFMNFHSQVRDHSLIARNNGWDEQRISAENTVNPIYYIDLQFAALSLDDRGLTYYGPYCVTLKEGVIAMRSSAFEENPFLFNPKHKIYSGKQPPLGYRASWTRRAALAEAKLGHLITSTTSQAEYSAILMGTNRECANCDFVEVHIYGMIHKQAIEQVTGPVPTDLYELALWEDCKRKLQSLGATTVEI